MIEDAGAPVRIKLRTHISLKFRYNFARPFHDLRPEWDQPSTLPEIGGGGGPPTANISSSPAHAIAFCLVVVVCPGKRGGTQENRPSEARGRVPTVLDARG